MSDRPGEPKFDPLASFMVEEVGDDDGDVVWLISYADLMTLLFTLFVMLYSSLVKNGEMDSVKRSLAMHFGTKYEHGIKQLNEVILTEVKDDPYLKAIETRPTVEGVEIIFTTGVLFDTGRADLRPDILPSFHRLAEILREKAGDHDIRVEGHTDDRVPNVNSKWISNWELSSSRATTIVRMFEAGGFDPKHLTAIGYGASRPKVENRSPAGEEIPENMAINRRVIVTVVAPLPGKATK